MALSVEEAGPVIVPGPTVVQSQVEVAETQANASLSLQPRSKLTPDEISRPEAEEVVEVVPDDVSETFKVTSPDEPPPDNPLPAVTAVMSPLPPVLSVDEMVMVEPEAEMEVAPEPAKVNAPATSLTLLTMALSSRATEGDCPAPITMPVPATRE